MKNRRIVSIFVIVLVLIEITSIFLMYKSGNNRKTTLDTVKLNEIDKYSGIALMLQQADGTYAESESGDWPTSGYVFNNTLSGCIDGNGNTLINALSYKGGVLTVKTRTNASCYLYFDIPDLNSLCSNYDDIDACSKREELDQVSGIWNSTLEDDGLRYTGTNPDNYICFGTTNQSDCMSDPDKYMYRIIGIFESDDGTQHLKLIKSEYLNDQIYRWHNNDDDTNWQDSDLYNGINGSYFLTNPEYSYMQDLEWYNKIATWNYTMTDTLTYESDGPDYVYITNREIYLHEMNKSNKTSDIGEWSTLRTKISLMYASDYVLAAGEEFLDYSTDTNIEMFWDSWMYDNDDAEIFMTRAGYDGQNNVVGLDAAGGISVTWDDELWYARPVFYLKSTTKLTSGNGTSTNPYIIEGTYEGDNLATTVIYNDTIEDDGLQQEYITGDDLYRFSGTEGNTGINNYICLGTDSCTSGDDNMYRIIGVNPTNHEVKVIKETPWNSSTTYKFHSANTSSIRWITSSLYTGTVSAIYDSLSFKDMIVQDHTWNIGSIGSYTTATRAAMVSKETASTTTANIGILSMTDYFLAFNGDQNWNSSTYYNTTDNWIGGYLNGNTSTYEWTMSHYNTYYAFAIYSTGRPYYRSFSSYNYVIRPTMYLSSNVMYVSGDGSSSNPYVVELKVEEEKVIENATAEDLISINPDGLWASTLEDDGYRFVGEDPDNYICFGTTDANECTSNTDLYMYRIIGIFEDSSGNKHYKLIKKEALDTSLYTWDETYSSETDWDESDLYNGINGSYFLTNTTYSYMQDSTWTNKIADWDYTATNTKAYENYSANSVYGINYRYNTVKTVYLHEMNRSSKTNQTCYYDSSTTADCSVGEWKTVNAKIGVMYVSDYLLSLGETAIDYAINSNGSTLLTGWMHITNNDSASLSTTAKGPLSKTEWTMSRHGANNAGGYYAVFVTSSGIVNNYAVDDIESVRPVFYLTSDVTISGEGTPNSPYIINSTAADTLIANAGDELWESTLEDDGYRYVGTNPSNYICFGTTDKDTCTGNTDLYMYRIIGIFEDTSGEKHLKLIKKEALTSAAWNANYQTDVDWDASTLYNGINGSYFLSNTTYSYMQDSAWTDKIVTWDYTATNTKTYENYFANSLYGPKYYYNTVKTVYLHEMNRSSKTSQTCYYNTSIIAGCSVGEWKTVNAKIGVMYASDYLLSLGETAIDYAIDSNSSTLKTGWMHISNNDSDASSTNEWTMSRYGADNDGYYYAWRVYSYGYVNSNLVHTSGSVRPVFYLTSDVTISGEGTSTNPYIIS